MISSDVKIVITPGQTLLKLLFRLVSIS